jgi:hypothetical protein
MTTFFRAATAAALLSATVMSACYSYPDTSERFNDEIIRTSYDKAASFNSYGTFAVAEQVIDVDDSNVVRDAGIAVVDDVYARPLRDEVTTELKRRGYVEVAVDQNPDLGVVIAVVSRLNVHNVYYPNY